MERLREGLEDTDDHAWRPVEVQTRFHAAPVDPVAYDCVKFMLIRAGQVTLLSEFGKRLAVAGDFIVLCATTLCGAIPSPSVTVTTAYVDPDYLLDQVLWNNAEALGDRLAAQSLVDRTYHFRAQVFHLPSPIASQVAQILDGIESTRNEEEAAFFSVQSHFSLVLRLLLRLMPLTYHPRPGMHSFPARGDLRTQVKYAPVRREILAIEQALRADLSRRWTVQEMAKIVYLSPRHLTRVFTVALGRTPISYLRMLRAKEMSRLLRETQMSVAEAGRSVGWSSRSHAREAFIACIGMSPAEYRLRFGGLDTDAWYRRTDESSPQVS